MKTTRVRIINEVNSIIARLVRSHVLVIICGLFAFFSAANLKAQSPIVVETIGALRGVNTSAISNDTVAYVIDYYDIFTSILRDRGGGHFRWFKGGTATDDGGHFINSTNASSTNGFWERVYDGGTPNVKMWGAYGNGTSNDTVAIQNALNAVTTYSDGVNEGVGELLFPAGTYLITNTLVFNASITHIRGEGPVYTTVLMKLGVSADIFHTANADNWLHNITADYDHGFIFEDMSLVFQDDGSNNGHPVRNTNNACLVTGIPGENSTIRNVFTSKGGIGIRCLGGGAPGLNLRDVKCFAQPIGVLIEPVPGNTNLDTGGPITIMGLSGDQVYGDIAAGASLVVVSNVEGIIDISSIKAEGDWGGGLIHYYSGNNIGGNQSHVNLHECYYNAGSTIDNQFYPPDFLKIDPSPLYNGSYGPVFSIQQVRINAIQNLINDHIGNRIVEADVQHVNGYQQLTAFLPLVYQANLTGAGYPSNEVTGSSLLIGETAISTFYATNTGWYRIMAPFGVGRSDMGGRVFITSPFSAESIEMQVDCTQSKTPWINVTRCKTGVAVVSQARAISYTDPTFGPLSFVDIYVSNALPAAGGQSARLTVGLDTEGVQSQSGLMTQLLAPIIPVSATPPSGATVTTVNTYR